MNRCLDGKTDSLASKAGAKTLIVEANGSMKEAHINSTQR
jgi:hypothetical protein